MLLIVVAGCGDGGSPPPNPHDSKFEKVASGDGCIRDSVTGLTWEIKSDEPGLRDWRNTYSWYSPNESHRELDYRGLKDGGQCIGSECDTWDYVRAVNATKLCGFSDWRLPSKDEFFSISDLTRAHSPPTANTKAFPYMQAAEYWSAHDYSFQYDSSWAWNFQYGHDRVDWKKSAKYVRLVRGDAESLDPVKE